jgi:microcystin-dependent protein
LGHRLKIMPITINGSGTVTGISAGGLPDDCIVTADIADDNITEAKIASGAVTQDKISTTVVTVPIGAVFHFAASTAPIGYLKCNGDTVTDGVGTVQSVTANFSALYAVLSSTYGAPGKLPDLRGEFIRGWDDGKGTDSGRVFGSSQLDALQNIQGVLANMWGFGGAGTSGALSSAVSGSSNQPGTGGGGSRDVSFNAANSTGARTATETRPRNIALLACIKY